MSIFVARSGTKCKGVTPGLAVVLIGDDPASRAYVRSKDKMCRELGLHSLKLDYQHRLLRPSFSTASRIKHRLEHSWDPCSVTTAAHIDEAAIVRALDPRKDVDGFHPENVAKLVLDDAGALSRARRWRPTLAN